MYTLITSSKDSDDLPIGFARDSNRRHRELTRNKSIKCKYHVRFMLMDVLGFADYQEKTTYGLGYNLTKTGIADNSVLNKDNAMNMDKIEIKSIEWYVRRYIPSVSQQAPLSNQILSKIPTELQ